MATKKQKPYWYRIGEKEPEPDQIVAVFNPDNTNVCIWPARYNADSQNFESCGGWFERDEVTHWTPLPTEGPDDDIEKQYED